FITKKANFNSGVKIIKTSVDRLEISIIIQPLFHNYFNDYRRLYFLIKGATLLIL
ncbi:hypothetical protein B0H65DRAFT_433612, partial [Neurospora tetraspora]